MRFHLLLSTALIGTFTGFPQQSGTETCRLDISGKAYGPSADVCQQLGDRWTALFGLNPIPGSIRLVNRDGYHGTQGKKSWTLESPLPQRNRQDSAYRKSDGLLRYFAEAVIPHEAGHHAFGVYVSSLGIFSALNRYSSPLPDWFDEAVATWMESAQLRQQRTRSVARTSPSLTRLVTLEHPNADLVNPGPNDFRVSTRTVMPPCAKCTFLPDSLRRKFQIVDSGTDAAGKPKTIIWYADKSPTKSATLEEREFYPLSYSLLRFIHTRGGAAAVRELIARYRVNPTPRVEVLSALPGLPASLPAFEKAWHAFLSSPPAERD